MSKKRYIKRFKCPYCEDRYERQQLASHIEKNHKEMIPQGYTSSRVAFNTINKKEKGSCIICRGEAGWNEDKKRYERICNNPECREEYIKMTDARLKNKKGITKKEMLSDPNFQDKMLKSRSISGTYVFEDNGKIPYVGSYEKNFLEFMDKFLHVKSLDIQAPGPTIEYYYNGKKHFWITDFYYVPYNLVLDIKDGGKNPNKRDMPEYRAKQSAKEKAIIKDGKYNYLRLTDNQFDQLLDIFIELKDSLDEMDGPYTEKLAHMKPIVKINEFSSIEPVHEVFLENDIEKILCDLLTNTNTYKTKDLTKVKQLIDDTSDTDTLLYINDFIRTALNEHCERWYEYKKFLESGKANHVMQIDCENLKKDNISLNDMDNIGTQLREIYNYIGKKLNNTNIPKLASGAVDISISRLTPDQLNKFNAITNEGTLTQEELEYLVDYVL